VTLELTLDDICM